MGSRERRMPETLYEVVARRGGFDTPIATAPAFDSLEKAEAWAQRYKAEHPNLVKDGATDIVARVQPPETRRG